MKNALFLVTLVLGIAMYAVAALWARILPVEEAWTDDRANRLVQVHERLAELVALQSKPVSMHSGPDRGTAQRELMDLVKERDKLVTVYENAMKRRHAPSHSLQALGILIVTIGVACWCMLRLREMRTPPSETLRLNNDSSVSE